MSKTITWNTSQAEFKIKYGVDIYLNAYCGKKHCMETRHTLESCIIFIS